MDFGLIYIYICTWSKLNFGLYMHACADNCIVYESKIQQKNLPKLSLKKKSKGKARNTGRFTTDARIYGY